MSYPVTYHCPQCEAVVELEREGYLADKTVTPYPLEGWSYVDPDGSFEDEDDVDGVRFVCGADEALLLTGEDLPDAADAPETGCGEPFYLSFVRFENGEELQPESGEDRVTIGVGPRQPRGPDSPGGPSGPRGD